MPLAGKLGKLLKSAEGANTREEDPPLEEPPPRSNKYEGE